jgi:hypothetical protein
MKDERGMAMILAITLIGLLSSLGLYLILESGSSYRATKSMVRTESVFNIAEGGVQLGLRCIGNHAPSPSYTELVSSDILPVRKGLPAFMVEQAIGGGTLLPTIDYVGYKTTPPPGWMINWQGYSSFHSLFFRSRTQASIPLPASQGGNAVSRISSFALKVTR